MTQPAEHHSTTIQDPVWEARYHRTGFGLGVVEGLTKYFYPEASNTVIFVIMVIVLLIKPAGLFGRER